MEFTQINPTQPEKPYGFAVQVTNDTNYQGEVVSVGDDNMLLLHHLVVPDSAAYMSWETMFILPAQISAHDDLLVSYYPAVTRYQPVVPRAAELEQKLLHGTIGFAGFVRAMRQQFKLLAESEAET